VKFNIGDILINKKLEGYINKIEIHYVIVGFDDTYTYIKRIDDGPYRSVRYPTQNMDWFFNVVSRVSE
jgi:hypothetical protein